MSNYTIALFIPYFGKFNNYFPLWLKSCQHNPTVDFFVFTDDKTPYSYPPNVHVEHTTFEKIKKQIQGLFDFKICLNTPYNLCDFRPAYGELFHDMIKNFDFWGYCDTDLIFGDIRHFLTSERLGKYDRLYNYGHLSLFRNTSEINTLYKTSGDFYKTVFSTPYYNSFLQQLWGFDENGINGINDILYTAKRPFYEAIDYFDVFHKRWAFLPAQTRKTANEKAKRYTIFRWENGKLWRIFEEKGYIKTEEIIYAHFQKRAMQTVLNDPGDAFIIMPNCFIENIAELDKHQLKQLGKNKLIYKVYFKRRFQSITKKLLALIKF